MLVFLLRAPRHENLDNFGNLGNRENPENLENLENLERERPLRFCHAKILYF